MILGCDETTSLTSLSWCQLPWCKFNTALSLLSPPQRFKHSLYQSAVRSVPQAQSRMDRSGSRAFRRRLQLCACAYITQRIHPIRKKTRASAEERAVITPWLRLTQSLTISLCSVFNLNINGLIPRELSGFTCTRSLTMNSKFSIPH